MEKRHNVSEQQYYDDEVDYGDEMGDEDEEEMVNQAQYLQ